MIPVGPSPHLLHAVFPRLAVEQCLAHHDGQLVIGPGLADGLENVIDLFAKLDIADQFAAQKYRLHRTQGEGSQYTQFEPRACDAGTFGLSGGKAIDLVPALVRVVQSHQADAMPVQEVKMRQLVFELQGFEQSAPILLQACRVVGPQRLLDANIGSQRLQRERQSSGLLGNGIIEIALGFGTPGGGLRVFLSAMLLPKQRHRPDDQQPQQGRQNRHQSAGDRLCHGPRHFGGGCGARHYPVF